MTRSGAETVDRLVLDTSAYSHFPSGRPAGPRSDRRRRGRFSPGDRLGRARSGLRPGSPGARKSHVAGGVPGRALRLHPAGDADGGSPLRQALRRSATRRYADSDQRSLDCRHHARLWWTSPDFDADFERISALDCTVLKLSTKPVVEDVYAVEACCSGGIEAG